MKCPACGYTTNRTQQSVTAKSQFKEFPLFVQEPLKELYHWYKKRIPRDIGTLNMSWNKLVSVIADSDLEQVRSAIHTFFYKDYHKEGKSLDYLRMMIVNNKKTWEIRKHAEMLKYGLNPPEVPLNEGEEE